MEAVEGPPSVIVEVNDGSGGGEKEFPGGNRSDGGRAAAAVVAEEEEITKGRRSGVSVCSVVLDLEVGNEHTMVHLSKSERDCRICHMSLDAGNQESGVPIELGCSCKDDLAAAHKQCAETWFKIKGNKICEVCGSMANNVGGAMEAESVERWDEANDAGNQVASGASASAPAQVAEGRNFWQGHRFLNFLLACMVFAFVISWLFHFNVPS